MNHSHNAQVLQTLSRHIGQGNGISVAELSKQTGLTERALRARITELRLEGQAICGTPTEGYFIAATEDELDRTCQFIRSRAMSSLKIESMMRKIPLPDLIGQLHLPT